MRCINYTEHRRINQYELAKMTSVFMYSYLNLFIHIKRMLVYFEYLFLELNKC